MCFGHHPPHRRRSDLDSHLCRNGARHVVLERQHIGAITLVALRPDRALVRRANQLSGDADAPSRLRYRAFHDCIDLEFARNFRKGLLCGALIAPLKFGRLRAVWYPRQLADEFVGHAVGEVFLCRVAREIVQRKNDN